jgi:hypothetical protein
MDVDETGRDRQAIDRDRALGGFRDLAQHHDLAVADPDIAAVRGAPRAVHDSSAGNLQIKHEGLRGALLYIGAGQPETIAKI